MAAGRFVVNGGALTDGASQLARAVSSLPEQIDASMSAAGSSAVERAAEEWALWCTTELSALHVDMAGLATALVDTAAAIDDADAELARSAP